MRASAVSRLAHPNPGNPSLTRMLKATDEETVRAYCTSMRARVGLPDSVMEALLDDMAIVATRKGLAA